MGMPELVEDERFNTGSGRAENREVLKELIESAFTKYTASDLVEKLEEAKIANARLNSVEEFVQHPQLKARNRWREVATPNGPIQALLPPATFSDFDPVMGAIPEVGENTNSILEEFGFDEDFISKCKESNII